MRALAIVVVSAGVLAALGCSEPGPAGAPATNTSAPGLAPRDTDGGLDADEELDADAELDADDASEAGAPLGTTCTSGAECASGTCADWVCCDAACGGVCEACDLAGSKGTCVPVVGAARHGSCPSGGADACAAKACDGAARAECAAFVSGVECAPRACADGVESLASTCDGSGTCPAAVTKTCAPYACDGNRCRTTCRSEFDCTPGVPCDVITHECRGGATCDGDHTITGGEAPKDCTPYKCSGSKCLEQCSGSDQCVAGFVCDPTSKLCVPPSSPAASGDEGGCATAPTKRSRSSRTGVPFVAVVLALSFAARRAAPAQRRR